MRDNFLKCYIKMHVLKSALIRDESGQDLIEYALVVSLIALAATAGMGTVATSISTAFTKVGSKMAVYTS
jgi:pilus assembly protein Flp/PilA